MVCDLLSKVIVCLFRLPQCFEIISFKCRAQSDQSKNPISNYWFELWLRLANSRARHRLHVFSSSFLGLVTLRIIAMSRLAKVISGFSFWTVILENRSIVSCATLN